MKIPLIVCQSALSSSLKAVAFCGDDTVETVIKQSILDIVKGAVDSATSLSNIRKAGALLQNAIESGVKLPFNPVAHQKEMDKLILQIDTQAQVYVQLQVAWEGVFKSLDEDSPIKTAITQCFSDNRLLVEIIESQATECVQILRNAFALNQGE